MTLEIIFLGTSGATPTKDRNLPAVAVRLPTGNLVIFDAGEDIQRQLMKANLKFNVPTTIFISHLHGDHVIGLPGLLFNFHLNNRTEPLRIIGPPGLASYLMMQHQYIGLKAHNYPLEVWELHLIKNEDEKIFSSLNHAYRIIQYTQFLSPLFERKVKSINTNQILANDEYTVKIYPLNHSLLNYGYRIEETPRKGKFNPEKAQKLGIPKGNLWSRMHNGEKIKLPNGRIIDPLQEKIVSPKYPGRIIAYSGDSTVCDNIRDLASNADVFICEATFSSTDENIAEDKLHMSARMAAKIASEANAKLLYLTHFSSRYRDINVLEKEAREIHTNTYAAYDLLKIKVKLKKKNKNLFIDNFEE